MALAGAAAPLLLLRAAHFAPWAAPAPRRRLLSGPPTAGEPPPQVRPPASKLADPPGVGAPEPPLPWRAAEAEILRDIDPVLQLIKDILHTDRLIGTLSSGSRDAFLLFEQMVFGLIFHTRSASVHISEKTIRLMLRDLYENISREHEVVQGYL